MSSSEDRAGYHTRFVLNFQHLFLYGPAEEDAPRKEAVEYRAQQDCIPAPKQKIFGSRVKHIRCAPVGPGQV